MGYRTIKRPTLFDEYPARWPVRNASTAASTAVPFGGLTTLTSTSTGGSTDAQVHTLMEALQLNMRMTLVTRSLASSSSPLHVVAPTNVTFDGSSGNMLVLSSGGTAVTLHAISSDLYVPIAGVGFSITTSTT